MGTYPVSRNPSGRPPTYSMEMMQQYCERLAAGDLSIDISDEEGMPSLSTVFRWREAHPEFREAYDRARIMQAHACAELATRAGRNATAEDAAAARVRMDANKWLAGRIDPAKWGDRVATQQLDRFGNPTDAPMRVVVELVGEPAAPRIEQSAREIGPRQIDERRAKVELVG